MSIDDDTQEVLGGRQIIILLDQVIKPRFQVNYEIITKDNFSRIITALEDEQSAYLGSLREIILNNGGFLNVSKDVLEKFSTLGVESLDKLMKIRDKVIEYSKSLSLVEH